MMKNVLRFSIFLSIILAYSQEFAPRVANSEYYYVVNDSIKALKIPILNTESSNILIQTKLPYPILFIHGLNSSSETWNTTTNFMDSQYNLAYGGRFDFCLNYDNSNAVANKLLYPASQADIAQFESVTLQNGDYYYLNFNVGLNGSVNPTGSNAVLSNLSAIAKQGVAVKKAIERILQLTGKNKVVLVGHSMGGLASREYIQNAELWQADNLHHVAKLLTLGTPNGGSNASDSYFTFFTGIDKKSEAIRDLKTTYYYSGDAGRYLFGGWEVNNSNNMNDNTSSPDFYNIDIDCNTQTGNFITGLNQKSIDNFIDYSSVIGRITGGTTDGIVDEPSSILDTYYPTLLFPSKLFYFNSTFDFIENHTELLDKYYQIMQGLDEPNFKELAYEIELNKNYIGFTTVQNPVAADNDFYKFLVGAPSITTVIISNIATNSMQAVLLDNAGNTIGTTQNNTGNSLTFSRTLASGNYFLKVTSQNPTNTNYETPYNFTISATLTTDEIAYDYPIEFYPNPVESVLYIKNYDYNKAQIYSVSGELLSEFDNENNTIETAKLLQGTYIIKLFSNEKVATIKIIKK